MAESDNKEAHSPVDLTLARAAAAFKDADFFESCILFWSAALDHPSIEDEDALESLAIGLDLEQELGLDVQAEDPIDLVFPDISADDATNPPAIDAKSISSIQTYILTALCYLARHINIRIDILPSGQDTLTSLGPPQRYFISFTSQQKSLYHEMLAIIFATTSSIATAEYLASSHESQEHLATWNHEVQIQQTTLLGNTAISNNWQTVLSKKKTPHNLPRFFSYLNTSSCTVAGCSIPRNELDINAFEQAGFRLVITLIKESPLSVSWFHHTQQGEQPIPKRIKNAFVPIENRKAPGFPEVFEVLMGWCVRTGHPDISHIDKDTPQIEHHHQRASLIHCGGGKGRAGIVLAAHLIRFGLLGHEGRGYCSDCIRTGNIHRYDLEQFRKGLGDQSSVESTLPHTCSSVMIDVEDDEDIEDGDTPDSIDGPLCPVKRSECLNRYKPMMIAKDAISHLRELRPGSIESVEQEKSIKAYGDWLWKRSCSKSLRSRSHISDTSIPQPPLQPIEPNGGTKQADLDPIKNANEVKRESAPKSKSTPVVEEFDEFSDDDSGRGRRSGKKGKKGSRKIPQEAPRVFVPPPADKIIKLPGSQHHQHHLVVQHNLRARELQRGQKSKKKNSGGGKQAKERPSYQVTGSPLVSAPKLVILAGLPGSGKSHFISLLLQEFPEHFVRISQDELGSRAVCERLLAQSMRHQQQSLAVRGPKKALPMTVFLDRCNPTIAERKEWYEVAFQPDETAIFWFSRSVEQCIERVDSRENHPTVAQGRGFKVVNSFAKGFEFPNLAKEGSWCKTLVEVGDDEGSDRLLEIMKKFAEEVPSSLGTRAPNAANEATPIKVRPAFIPARVLQRKSNSAAGGNGESGFDSSSSHPKIPSTGSMAIVEEEDEEEELEDEVSDGSADEGDEVSNVSDERDINIDEDTKAKENESVVKDGALLTLIPAPYTSSSMSITSALQFATLTGHRPAVKKPVKGSWRSSTDANDASSSTLSTEPTSPKGVSFATPLSSHDRPLQKFPRTPHLFDPLTIHQSRQQGTDRVVYHSGPIESEVPGVGRSAAISRSDLLLPPSALHQFFAPKPHQVLTVEEKMDGANIGFSVLHFKTMNGFAGVSGDGPPPKIRVQNRNHFVHPDDHWQYKKLSNWLEKHREDILWLCEGRWRYESQKNRVIEENDGGIDDDVDDVNDKGVADDKEDLVVTDDGDESWVDEDVEDDEDEYIDEDKVLQDGLAPYVLYGEWLYAKHSVQYTGLRSWFIPFDLFDIKTGTFVSRKLFQKAIAKTQLTTNPVVQIPKEIYGDVEKTLEWTLKMLQSRSVLMKEEKRISSADDLLDQDQQQDRVEGLYFRIDQGERLLMRSKVVRPDFIAGDERWGAKEQIVNKLLPYEELLPDYNNCVEGSKE
ncbi:Dual specificity protein phosphatase 23 [Haplosporangium sp. Z 27]|nr:Dual specificity protein phosphatase 23 [Haplosporangium sp. Z 27]